MSVVIAILMTVRVERGTSMSVATMDQRDEILRLHGLEFDILCQVIDDNLSEGIKATQYANTKMMNALRDDFHDYRTEFTTFRSYVDTRFHGIDTRFDGVDTRLDGIDGRLDGVDTRLNGIDGRLDGIDGRLDGMSGEIKEMRGDIGHMKGNIQEILRRLPVTE
jgi:hypothetical protein